MSFIGVFQPDPQPVPDARAQQEALKLNSGSDLEKDGRENEHRRHQQFRNHVNTATLVLFWVIVFCVLVGVVAFAFHLVFPKGWHYLDEDQLDQLKTMLGAAVLSSALTGYASKRMA